MRRTLLALLISIVAVATSASAVDSNFYRSLLDRGMSSYAAGDYPAAAKLLQIASFGLLDSVPDYERALVYLTLAQQKSGLLFDAKKTVVKILEADRVKPTLASLNLDPIVRTEFNEIARSSISESQYAFLQDGARTAGSSGLTPPPGPNPPGDGRPPLSAPVPTQVPFNASELWQFVLYPSATLHLFPPDGCHSAEERLFCTHFPFSCDEFVGSSAFSSASCAFHPDKAIQSSDSSWLQLRGIDSFGSSCDSRSLDFCGFHSTCPDLENFGVNRANLLSFRAKNSRLDRPHRFGLHPGNAD